MAKVNEFVVMSCTVAKFFSVFDQKRPIYVLQTIEFVFLSCYQKPLCANIIKWNLPVLVMGV